MQQTGENEPPASTRLDSRTGITWVWMPSGTFEQGCVPGDSECDSDEKPAIAKTVRGFWLAKTETTVKQFEACGAQGKCNSELRAQDVAMKTCNWKNGRSTHPMNCLTWSEAKAYCEWAGGRLPSATEWEYAARGPRVLLFAQHNSVSETAQTDGNALSIRDSGLTAEVLTGGARGADTKGSRTPVSGSGTRFPWGDSAPDGTRANFCDTNCPNALAPEVLQVWKDNKWIADAVDDGFADTSPVGSFPAGETKWGFVDMAGNVWEMTATDYDANKKEVRGGSWLNSVSALRVSRRGADLPTVRSAYLGFRCAQ